jgi:hypothetical protein
VSAAGVVSDRALDMLALPDATAEKLRAPENTGGSVIVGPDREVVAGPLGTDEGMLSAEIDLAAMVPQKLTQDYAGHYNRPDIFEFSRAEESDPADRTRARRDDSSRTDGVSDTESADSMEESGDTESADGVAGAGESGTTGGGASTE